MRIKSLQIYGYGKFVDEEFSIEPEFQVFYGPNESGKTTLYDFIEQILFGFPDRRHMERRHEPNKSSNYGGGLVVSDRKYGEVFIERKGKEISAGEVTLRYEDGKTGGLEELSLLLKEVDIFFYKSLYSVNLDALQNVADLTESKLNRLLISVTSLGSERFIDLAENYENKAQKMYTAESKTREIDDILGGMDRLQIKINEAQALNDSYSRLYNEIEEIITQQNEYENQITEKKQRIEYLEKMLNKVEEYEEYQALKKELKENLDFFTPVRETDKRRFENLREKNRKAKLELEKLEKQKKEVQEYRNLPEDLVKYQENETVWNNIFKGMDEAEKILEEEKNIEHSESTLAKDIERDKERLGLSGKNEELRTFDNSEIKEIDIIEKRFQNLNQEKKKQETHKMTLNVQEENLKHEIEKLSLEWEGENDNDESSFSFKATALLGGSGLLLFIILSSPARYIFLLSGVILLIFSIYNYTQFSNEKTSRDLVKENSKKNLQEKQKQHEKLLHEITQLNSEINQLEKLIEEENTQWAYLKEEVGINNQWTIKEYKNYQSYYVDLIANIMKLKNYTHKKKKLSSRLEKHMEIIEPLKEEIDPTVSIENKILQVKQLEKRVASQKEQATEAVQSIGYIQRDINVKMNEVEESVRNLEEFYRDFQVTDANDFSKLIELTETRGDKEKKHDQLQKELEPYLEEFSQITSPKEWEKEIMNSDYEIDLLHKKKQENDELRTDKRAQMQRIEQGGELSDLLQKYEDKRAILQEKVDERTTYQVAAEIIKRVLKHTNEDAAPQLLSLAEEIFQILTEGNYINIYIEDGKVELVRKDKEIFKAHELSTGTKEQLYMALKLAFIKMMIERFSLPLLIDDGFVNFDNNRKKEVIQILRQFSKDNQIIYFTFDKTGLDELSSDQVTML